MAIVKRKYGKSVTNVMKQIRKKIVEKKTMSQSDHIPSDNLGDYPIMFYGERKIGKTTLSSMFPNHYFFMFEENNSYKIRKDDIEIWKDFTDLVPQFIDSNRQTGIVSTAGVAFNMALQHACEEMGIEHPGGQNDFGQAWDRVNTTFAKPMLQLMKSNKGFIAECHQKEKDITTMSGRTFVKMCPDLPTGADKLLTGQIYNIFYYHFGEDNQRWLQIIGDGYVTAGHRMKWHFLTPSGEPVFRIPMGTDEEEAYANLMLAFNNKQKLSYKIEKELTTKKFKKKVK